MLLNGCKLADLDVMMLVICKGDESVSPACSIVSVFNMGGHMTEPFSFVSNDSFDEQFCQPQT